MRKLTKGMYHLWIGKKEVEGRSLVPVDLSEEEDLVTVGGDVFGWIGP